MDHPAGPLDLVALGDRLLTEAAAARSGRSGQTVYGDRHHHLRQTVIALRAGEAMRDHESPGEATLHVLVGHVRLGDETDTIDCHAGDLVAIPPRRHRLDAVTDAVVLLTVAVAG